MPASLPIDTGESRWAGPAGAKLPSNSKGRMTPLSLPDETTALGPCGGGAKGVLRARLEPTLRRPKPPPGGTVGTGEPDVV